MCVHVRLSARQVSVFDKCVCPTVCVRQVSTSVCPTTDKQQSAGVCECIAVGVVPAAFPSPRSALASAVVERWLEHGVLYVAVRVRVRDV